MRKASRLSICLPLLALALWTTGSYSQETAAEDFPNPYCLDCHGDPDLESEAERSMFVDLEALARSEHAGMSCVACHDPEVADFEDIPHSAEPPPPVACIDCHQRTGFVWQEYFHNMMAANGHGEIPDCQDCHGAPHDARRRLAMEIVCNRCHQDVADAYSQSYHSRR